MRSKVLFFFLEQKTKRTITNQETNNENNDNRWKKNVEQKKEANRPNDEQDKSEFFSFEEQMIDMNTSMDKQT